jgi:hypothetical protein
LAQTIDLGVYDLLAPRDPNAFVRDPDDGQLRWHSMLRVRHDFGPWQRDASGTSATLISAVDNRQLDLLYAYLEGTNFARSVDFRIGRQLEYSALDFFAFDGAWLRVRAPRPKQRYLALELFGGAQANAASVMGYTTFERDGVAPELAGKRAPMFGAALATTDLRRISARLAYRRILSTEADTATPKYRDGADQQFWAIEEEVVSATTGLELVRNLVHLHGAARYNFATGRFDQAMTQAIWQPTALDLVRLAYQRSVFAGDTDSIFNIFNIGAFEDLRMQVQRTLRSGWTLASRSGLRWDHSQVAEDKIRYGASFGGTLARRHRDWGGMADVDYYVLGPVARLTSVVDVRHYAWSERLRSYARVLYMHSRDRDPLRRNEIGLFAQAGVEAQLWRQITFGLSAEEGTSSSVKHSLRVLAVLAIDWNMRLGGR